MGSLGHGETAPGYGRNTLLLEKRSAEMPGSVVPNPPTRLHRPDPLRSHNSLPVWCAARALNSAFLQPLLAQAALGPGASVETSSTPRWERCGGTGGCTSERGEADVAVQGGMGEDMAMAPCVIPFAPVLRWGPGGVEWGVGSERLRYCRI